MHAKCLEIHSTLSKWAQIRSLGFGSCIWELKMKSIYQREETGPSAVRWRQHHEEPKISDSHVVVATQSGLLEISEPQQPGFKCWLCSLPILWPWVCLYCHWASFSSLVRGDRRAHCLWGYPAARWEATWKAPLRKWPVGGTVWTSATVTKFHSHSQHRDRLIVAQVLGASLRGQDLMGLWLSWDLKRGL